MFDTNKKYQCPSEFGLYKCDETNEYFSARKKQIICHFGYLLVVLTSVIVLSSVCLVVYNYAYSPNSKLSPHLINNNYTQSSTDQNTTFIPFINISFTHEFSKENIKNNSEFLEYDDSIPEKTEPQALEYSSGNFKKYFPESNIPRPFIYETRDPKPSGFQVPSNHKPKIYEDNVAAENIPIRTRVRNIQDIIKLLSNQNEDDSENTNKRNKLSRNQKKMRNSNSKRKHSQPFDISDPFFPYKPQNPSDINLLATNGVRFAPTVQLEYKKPSTTEQYPNYERPIDQKFSSYNEQPISVTLDLSQSKNQRLNKRKPINYPIGFNNLYNQNQYFIPRNKFPTPQQHLNKQPYFKPWNNWNLGPNRHKGRPTNTNKVNNPMIVHLNLYPKKHKYADDSETGETRTKTKTKTHNCTEDYFPQIKNASEINQLLEQTRHLTLDPIYNDKVTITDKNNDDESLYSEMIHSNDANVEIQKSIGFTIINPNLSTPMIEDDYYSQGDGESQWHPITFRDEENISNARDDKIEGSDKDEHYGLEVGEVNEGSDETVTLPLPQDLFQKYFNSKPITTKYNEEWDPKIIRDNPNLVNHRASF